MRDAIGPANPVNRRLRQFPLTVQMLVVTVAALVFGHYTERAQGRASDTTVVVTTQVPAGVDLGVRPVIAEGASASDSIQTPDAKAWVGQHEEIEEYLRAAEIIRMAEIGVGVTNPNRAWLAPGGVVDSIAWKPDTPGERYKPEIAAYELDKLLDLTMVPVTVQKSVNGVLGAAKMWVSPTRSFDQWGGMPTPPANHLQSWERQLVRAWMFENLIYNADRNLANWLVDPSWNVILIDHNRAFSPLKTLPHKLPHVDRDLWQRMQALDGHTLTSVLGRWLSDFAVRIILERRDMMAQRISEMVEERGAHDVFLAS